jgi:hypothetical protein
MMSNLADRIALILQTEAASDAIAAILADVQAELLIVREASAAAQEKVLDPVSGTAAVTKARKELDDFTLQASRLEAAVDRLTSQLATACAREGEVARAKVYEEAKAERDALAKEILETYTDAAARIAGMLMRVNGIDLKVTAANQDRPEGAPYLELVARITQIPGGWDLTNAVRLPAIASVGVPAHLKEHPTQQMFWPTGSQ